jgi:UDP-glucuronate 4-epimerase
MVLFKFTKAILEGRPIDLFNDGHMQRDFTYVDDVVESVVRIMDVIPTPDPHWSSELPDPSSSLAPFRLYNVGNHEPVDLLELIALLEEALGRKAEKRCLPMQPGDVPATYADMEGIGRFVAWYREFYGLDDGGHTATTGELR